MKKVQSRVFKVYLIMLIVMLGIISSVELNIAKNVKYGFMEVVEVEGAMLSTPQNTLVIEVDGVVYNIEVDNFQTLLAYASYDKYSNDIDMNNVEVVNTLQGNEVIVYTNSDILYHLQGNIVLNVCIKNDIVMLIQTNDTKLKTNMRWE